MFHQLKNKFSLTIIPERKFFPPKLPVLLCSPIISASRNERSRVRKQHTSKTYYCWQKWNQSITDFVIIALRQNWQEIHQMLCFRKYSLGLKYVPKRYFRSQISNLLPTSNPRWDLKKNSSNHLRMWRSFVSDVINGLKSLAASVMYAWTFLTEVPLDW